MRWALLLLLVLAACPAPRQYAVERSGLTCDRATRVARRTFLELGYTVTALVPAAPEHSGEITGTKTLADGTTVTGRVRIRCDREGAGLQPLAESLAPSYDFSRAFDYSFKSLVDMPDFEVPRAARGLEVLVHVVRPDEALLDLGGEPVGPDAVLVHVTIRNNTERAVSIDPARLDLVPGDAPAAGPLAGPALAAAMTSGPAADRVRAERLAAQRDLGEARLVPGRASRRARLERTSPVPERGVPVARVGRRPGGAAQGLRRRRLPLQRLLVETSCCRRIPGAQGQIGEGDAVARVARLARERPVHPPRERDGGSAAVRSRPLGLRGELAA